MRRCFPIPCSLCFSHCLTPAPSTYHSGWGGPFLKQLRKGLPRGRADEDGQCSSDSGHTGECECCRAYCSYTSAPLSCRKWEMGWTVALETRMWHMCTWGTPLDSTTSSSTLTKREQGPAASSPWPGPTTWPSKPVSKHLVCFPAFTNCPLIAEWRQGWGLDGILSMGLRGIWFLSYPSHKVPEGNTWNNSSWNLSCWGDPFL